MQIKPLIQKYFSNVPHTIIATSKQGGAQETTEQLIKDGCDCIVACGGDGTIHEAVNAIMDVHTCRPRAALAIVPMGMQKQNDIKLS